MTKYLQRLLRLSQSGARHLTQAVISQIIVDVLLLCSAALIYFYFEDTLTATLQGKAPVFRYTLYIIYTIVLLLLSFIFNYIQYNALYLVVYQESEAKRISLAERLRRLPLSYFSHKDLTDISTTMMNDVSTMEQTLSHFIPQLISSAITTTFISIGLIAYNWQLGIAVVWVIPVAFSVCYLTKRKQHKAHITSMNISLEVSDKVQEFLENVRDIKSNTREQGHLDTLKDLYAKHEKALMRGELGVGICVTIAQMILKLGIISTAFVGLYLLSLGEISLLVFILYMLATRLYDPVEGALINIAATFASLISVKRIADIEEIPTQTGIEAFTPRNYNIEFKNVKFAYRANEWVLNDVTFSAEQGKVTAIVGESGGGKSTAIKLAARFWDIQKGTITLGNTDISKIDPEILLRNFAIVFQDVLLFNNTIMENIRIGKQGANDEQVIEVAKAANCHDFITALPDGYNTMLGENGTRISGGERQRLSIARALLKNAPIILLDEATSALDVHNETLLQQAISKLTQNKTVIVVAHRMRTIAAADKIILIEQGKIAEQGTHQELMAISNSKYARMVELQTLSKDWKI